MSKKDLIFIAIVLVVAFSILIITNLSAQRTDLLAVITVDGDEYQTILLNSQDTSFRIETKYGYNDVVIENNEVNIIDANCPTKVCVNTKIANKEGDLIVCLPHKVVIEILPNGN